MTGNYSDEIQYAVGVGSGYGVYRSAKQIIKKTIGRFYKDQLCNVPKADNDALWIAANKAYQNSDLKNFITWRKKRTTRNLYGEVVEKPEIIRRRATIINLNSSNVKQITHELMEKHGLLKKNPILDSKIYKLFFGDPKKKLAAHVESVARGENACHVTKTGQVLVNKDRMAFSTFHELGHAMNATGTGVRKALSRSRGAFVLGAPLIFLIGLLKNKKSADEEQSTKDKIYGFIKENCGILTSLCFLPTIAEEGFASMNGAKLAKPYLDKSLYKKMNVLNGKAWTSYVIAAAVAGICAKVGVYVRDQIVKNKN